VEFILSRQQVHLLYSFVCACSNVYTPFSLDGSSPTTEPRLASATSCAWASPLPYLPPEGPTLAGKFHTPDRSVREEATERPYLSPPPPRYLTESRGGRIDLNGLSRASRSFHSKTSDGEDQQGVVVGERALRRSILGRLRVRLKVKRQKEDPFPSRQAAKSMEDASDAGRVLGVRRSGDGHRRRGKESRREVVSGSGRGLERPGRLESPGRRRGGGPN